MSLIDFPDVPFAPGVPNIRRSAVGIGAVSGILGEVLGVDAFGFLDGILGPQWGIFDKNGGQVILPDSVVAFDYRGEQRISKYPVELGSFSSYNKVALPYDIRILMTCSGQGAMSRDQFLQQLELLKETTELYDLATPDFTYQDVNLVRFDYRRTSSNGVTLLTVDAQFEEVRQTEVAIYSATAEPQGQPVTSIGAVQPVSPTPQQEASFDARAIA
ncbi:phage baseplate protein [Pseudomonas sp. HS-18]|uniref:phage baseplate protein n=1 Tax=Pseudomonas sp. HS-18 TaxID=2879114 RepID=UPI001CF0062F|nr:hypothetical protein [Pseudomonas sp. HS-18]UCL84494.1 hypothetical protein LDJ84_16075 [Pseudomonas sp. HS-18]